MEVSELQAVAMPAAPGSRPAAAGSPLGAPWGDLVARLELALEDTRAGTDWLGHLFAVHAQVRTLARRRYDASLYQLIYTAGHSTASYSSHHALLSLLICEQAAPLLNWSQRACDALGRAALTMNVSMVHLQDHLAQTRSVPTTEMKRLIDAHPQDSAAMLGQAGLADELCLAVVRLHHDASDAATPLADLSPERQLARLLRRVDIFCAKLSRRRGRMPMSPVQAAQEACLGVDGQIDDVGAALHKSVGLFPPGSFVRLLSGEIAIVLARGRRANRPLVAALIAPGGTPLGEPALRDTLLPEHAVVSAVPLSQVKLQPPHDKLLALR